MQRLSRPTRRALLVVHVTASVSWVGITVCLLALGIAGAVNDAAASAEAAHRAMKVFGDWLLVPVALLTLVSGLVLSLGTRWGLALHRWVYTKFWITLAATAATTLFFRDNIDSAHAAIGSGEPVSVNELVAPPTVSLSLYLFMTAISVLKPWGLTRRGRRLRHTALRARAGGHSASEERTAAWAPASTPRGGP